MTGDRTPGTQLEQWISIGATIVAPVTVARRPICFTSATSRTASEYAYFGIDVDTIGLSTQDYIMRSPQTLLVPLLVLTLGGAGFLMLNVAVRGRVASAVASCSRRGEARTLYPARHVEHIRHMVQGSRIFGLAVLIAGVVLLFTYSYFRNWALYPLVTPLLIALGAAIIAYTSHVPNLLQRLQDQQALATAKRRRTGRDHAFPCR